MLEAYRAHVADRAAQGLPPLPLSPEQTASLVELLKVPSSEADNLLDLLVNRVPPGVDQAAYVKAAFLADITKGKASSPLISKETRKLIEKMGCRLIYLPPYSPDLNKIENY